MSNRSKETIYEDGVDFAKYNNSMAKEKKADTSSKLNDKNFDFNAKKNIKR